MDELRQHCNSCATIADCKAAFGAFWRDRKAHGGVGCNHPFPGYDRVPQRGARVASKKRRAK